MKKMTCLLLSLLLSLAVLSGCGGAKKEEGPDTSFLMGSWFAKTATQNGQTVDASDVFGGQFMLTFNKDDCTMAIDSNRAVVKWELTEQGVTLKGDDTYEITFPDEERKTMIAVIRGVEVSLEKYEEDEG